MSGPWLVVRAVVADPDDHAAFDTWYRQEHLPDAMKAFSASAAWRGWLGRVTRTREVLTVADEIDGRQTG
jgi:hypothetical protein